MKYGESGFLGLILGGVLMMVIGLGLTISPARLPRPAHVALAAKQVPAQASSQAARDEQGYGQSAIK